jgi:hypothetical protein
MLILFLNSFLYALSDPLKWQVKFAIPSVRTFNLGYQQDKQCMYNVTLRRVRVIIVAVDKQ